MVECESVLEHFSYQESFPDPSSSIDSDKLTFFTVVQVVKSCLLNISSYYFRHNIRLSLPKVAKKVGFGKSSHIKSCQK